MVFWAPKALKVNKTYPIDYNNHFTTLREQPEEPSVGDMALTTLDNYFEHATVHGMSYIHMSQVNKLRMKYVCEMHLCSNMTTRPGNLVQVEPFCGWLHDCVLAWLPQKYFVEKIINTTIRK